MRHAISILVFWIFQTKILDCLMSNFEFFNKFSIENSEIITQYTIFSLLRSNFARLTFSVAVCRIGKLSSLF